MKISNFSPFGRRSRLISSCMFSGRPCTSVLGLKTFKEECQEVVGFGANSDWDTRKNYGERWNSVPAVFGDEFRTRTKPTKNGLLIEVRIYINFLSSQGEEFLIQNFLLWSRTRVGDGRKTMEYLRNVPGLILSSPLVSEWDPVVRARQPHYVPFLFAIPFLS